MAIDPVTIGIATEVLGRGATGYQTYSAQKDLFDEDAAKRLKELERMEAINMLGGDIQTYQSQQMTPVQGAMREARERMAQDISSQDLSGGAYFRGQQAMTEAAGKERAAAQQRSQEQYRREEEINRAELDSLRKRKQMADNAARDAFLAAMEGADKSAQSFAVMKIEQDKIQSLRDLAGKNLTPEETKIASMAYDTWNKKDPEAQVKINLPSAILEEDYSNLSKEKDEYKLPTRLTKRQALKKKLQKIKSQETLNEEDRIFLDMYERWAEL